jgi:cell wall-associated NlpC family hydrolase
LRECIVARAHYYAAAETHYRIGSTGPTYFDCTGLVYRVFEDCAALDLIGALGEQDVRSYYDWFSAREQADTQMPKLGDLIVYGPDFAHIGIYTGDGTAISTLTKGVQEHSAVQLRTAPGGQIMPVHAYLHLDVR